MNDALNVTVVVWKEAAESEIVSPFVVTVSTSREHPDSVGHWVSLSPVSVGLLRQQSRDAHHLRRRLRFLHFVIPGRQLGAEDDGGNHEDGGQRCQ